MWIVRWIDEWMDGWIDIDIDILSTTHYPYHFERLNLSESIIFVFRFVTRFGMTGNEL